MNLSPAQTQAVRVAVARVDGFTNIRMSKPWEVTDPEDEQIVLCGEREYFGGSRDELVPNYPNSIDACRAVVMKLPHNQQAIFDLALAHEAIAQDNFVHQLTALDECVILLKTVAPDEWDKIERMGV